jgi:hypothetical protein
MPAASTLLASLVGFAAGVCLTLQLTGTAAGRSDSHSDTHNLRQTINVLQRQLAAAQHRATQQAQVTGLASKISPPQQRWTDTADNRRIHDVFTKVANQRGEVMVALANDVMMCTNRKTCWWNGGNVLETFLKGTSRLSITNLVIITLDDETERFCQGFHASHGGAKVTSIRLEMPVPTAQQGSRGANMISTLKYGLLRQALLMGFAVLVVDLDLVFLKDPFEVGHARRCCSVLRPLFCVRQAVPPQPMPPSP